MNDGELAKPEPPPERLSDILPPTIKSLTLLRSQDVDAEFMRHLLKGLAEVKMTKFPKLMSLNFECENPMDDAMTAALKATGMTLMFRLSPYEAFSSL